jgi:hypothetical protein
VGRSLPEEVEKTHNPDIDDYGNDASYGSNIPASSERPVVNRS